MLLWNTFPQGANLTKIYMTVCKKDPLRCHPECGRCGLPGIQGIAEAH